MPLTESNALIFFVPVSPTAPADDADGCDWRQWRRGATTPGHRTSGPRFRAGGAPVTGDASTPTSDIPAGPPVRLHLLGGFRLLHGDRAGGGAPRAATRHRADRAAPRRHPQQPGRPALAGRTRGTGVVLAAHRAVAAAPGPVLPAVGQRRHRPPGPDGPARRRRARRHRRPGPRRRRPARRRRRARRRQPRPAPRLVRRLGAAGPGAAAPTPPAHAGTAGRATTSTPAGTARRCEAALEAMAAEPLRETPHRLVVRIHLAEGNAFEAVHAFYVYRDLLMRELRLEPSPAMCALLDETLAPIRQATRRTPAPPAPRIGTPAGPLRSAPRGSSRVTRTRPVARRHGPAGRRDGQVTAAPPGWTHRARTPSTGSGRQHRRKGSDESSS